MPSTAIQSAGPDTPRNKGGASVPALRRAVAILDVISGTSDKVSASCLARQLGIPKSTLHGLLTAMEELGLIFRDGSGHIQIGSASLPWSRKFSSESGLSSAFERYVESTRNTPSVISGYTMTLTILDGPEVMYIACSPGTQPLGVSFQVGMKLPAPFTATGKALLATLSDQDLEALFSPGFPKPLTRLSVPDLDTLRSGFERQRDLGYSIDDGETREGMICLGAVIRDSSGKACAGLALSVTRTEAETAHADLLGSALRDAAATISGFLGAP